MTAGANRPHFHVRIRAQAKRPMWYAWRIAFHTRQAAQQYAARRLPKDRFEVYPCENPECAPKLD